MDEKPTPRRRAKRDTPTPKADRVEQDKSTAATKRAGTVRKKKDVVVDARARQRARDRAG